MSELLTAKDVEVKVFKKVRFGGYSVPEVEDFLNQVADDLEAYAIQVDDKEARIQELEEHVKKLEARDEAIKGALIDARQAAQIMEDKAKAETAKIISDAQAEADKKLADAESQYQEKIQEAERKASEILMKAKNNADDIIQASQDRRAKAEQSRVNIEQELESRRKDAEDKADDILSEARSEARRIVSDAEKEIGQYEADIKYLSLQKQQFIKNTVSLLLDFGKIIDKAQQEIDAENGGENHGTSDYMTAFPYAQTQSQIQDLDRSRLDAPDKSIMNDNPES